MISFSMKEKPALLDGSNVVFTPLSPVLVRREQTRSGHRELEARLSPQKSRDQNPSCGPLKGATEGEPGVTRQPRQRFLGRPGPAVAAGVAEGRQWEVGREWGSSRVSTSVNKMCKYLSYALASQNKNRKREPKLNYSVNTPGVF